MRVAHFAFDFGFGLRAIRGITCGEPQGAFYCFPDVSSHYGRTIAGVDVTSSMTFAQAESQTIARIRAQGIQPSGLSDVIRLGPAALGVMSGAFVEGQIPEAEDFAASMGKGEANNFLRGLSYFSIVGNIMRIAGDWQRVAESR